MAGVVGLEPTTYPLTADRILPLSYTPLKLFGFLTGKFGDSICHQLPI